MASQKGKEYIVHQSFSSERSCTLFKVMPLYSIGNIQFDHRISEIIQIEPRIEDILDRALFTEVTPEYDRIHSYYSLRKELEPLLGWYAEHPALRNSGDYQLIIETLMDLLPLDLNESPLFCAHPPFP